MMDCLGIGNKIKSIRISADISQKELATLLGVSVGYIKKLETGELKAELDFVHRLSVIYRCDMLWMLLKK